MKLGCLQEAERLRAAAAHCSHVAAAPLLIKPESVHSALALISTAREEKGMRKSNSLI